MANKKPLIFLYPINDTLESIKEIIQKNAEENNVEIFEINDIKEMKQVIPSLGQALVITAGAKSCIMMLQECRRHIKKKNTKVVLLSQKQINRKITDRMMKMGLTELITEPVPQKTILYKINLLIRSLEVESDDKGPKLKSLERAEDKRSKDDSNNLINNNESPIEVNLTKDEMDRTKNKNQNQKEVNQEKVKRLLEEQKRKKQENNNKSKFLTDSPLEIDLSEEENKRIQSTPKSNDDWKEKSGLKPNKKADNSSPNSTNLDDENSVNKQNEVSSKDKKTTSSNHDLENMENTLRGKSDGQDIIKDDIHKMRSTEFSHENMKGDVRENELARNSNLRGNSSGNERMQDANLEGQLKKQDKIDSNLKGLLSDNEDKDDYMSGEVDNQNSDDGPLKGTVSKLKEENGPLVGRDSLLQDDDGLLQGEFYSSDQKNSEMLEGNILSGDMNQSSVRKNKTKFEEKRESYFKGLLTSNSTSDEQLEGAIMDNQQSEDHYTGNTLNDGMDDYTNEDGLLSDIDSLNDKLSSDHLLTDEDDGPYGHSLLDEAQRLKDKLAAKSKFKEEESEMGSESDYNQNEIEKFYKGSMLHDDGINGGYLAAHKRKQALKKTKGDTDTYFEDIYGTKDGTENKNDIDEEDFYSTGATSLDEEKNKKKTEQAYIAMTNKTKDNFDTWDEAPLKKHELLDSQEKSYSLENKNKDEYASNSDQSDKLNYLDMENQSKDNRGSEELVDDRSPNSTQNNVEEDLYKKDNSQQSSELSMEEIHQNKNIPVDEEQFASLFSEDSNSARNTNRENDDNIIDYNKIRKQFNKGSSPREILLENKTQSKENFERIKREIESKKEEMHEESTVFPPIIKGIEYCIKASHWANKPNVEDIDLLSHISQVIFDELAGICCFYEFDKYSQKQKEIFIGHNKLFNSIELLDQEVNWSQFKESFLEKWLKQTLPYWHDEDFNSVENHFFYPFFEGSNQLGFAVIDFQDDINPEYAKVVEVIVSMARSYYLRDSLESPDMTKGQEKNNNFFGKIFSRKKA